MTRNIVAIVNDRGDLVIAANTIAREALQKAESYDKRECIVAEELHERYEFILPEEIGALTAAPILCHTDDTTILDDGSREFVRPDHPDPAWRGEARIYWFPNYAIRDPWEELAVAGSVLFDLARE